VSLSAITLYPIVSSLDFSEDPNLNSEDDYNHYRGYDNLKVYHLLFLCMYYNAF